MIANIKAFLLMWKKKIESRKCVTDYLKNKTCQGFRFVRYKHPCEWTVEVYFSHHSKEYTFFASDNVIRVN